jgi:hypothetical protein
MFDAQVSESKSALPPSKSEADHKQESVLLGFAGPFIALNEEKWERRVHVWQNNQEESLPHF